MAGQIKATLNLQDAVLNCLRKEKISIIIHLMDGKEVRGTIKSFDNYTVLVEASEKLQLVYKHAVTFIEPMKHIGELLRKQAEREK